MALLDISNVTRVLTTFLREAFNESDAWTLATPPPILPEPPVFLDTRGVGMYLYHAVEDAHYKNLPAPGRDTPPVRYTPMGLKLYYHLSANEASTQDNDGVFNEQLMMGIAIKALRDYPEITRNTSLNGITPFDEHNLSGSNDRFRIVLNPVQPNEAISFWTAGDSHVKLSAYYEVSVVLLEPPAVQSRSARVLSYGVHAFVQGAPRIVSTRNTISFTIPGESAAREVTSQPAQVPSGMPFSLVGTGFGNGQIDLLLFHAGSNGPASTDPGPAAWNIGVNGDIITARAHDTAQLDGVAVPVLPGIYAAQIRVSRRRTLPNGQERDFEHLSNQCPFAIGPRIDAISALDASQTFTVEGYIFRHPELDPAQLRVYIAEFALTVGTAGALNPGEYATIDGLNPGDLPRLEIRLPGGLPSTQHVPLRIFVNGVESPPAWIEVP